MQLPKKKWISELWKERTKNERMSIFLLLYVLQFHLFLKHSFRMPHEFFKCFPPWNEPWVYSIKHLISSHLISLSLSLLYSLIASLLEKAHNNKHLWCLFSKQPRELASWIICNSANYDFSPQLNISISVKFATFKKLQNFFFTQISAYHYVVYRLFSKRNWMSIAVSPFQ